MAIRKAWIFTAAFSLGCAAVSAGVNLLGKTSPEAFAQPAGMIGLRIGAAFLGSFCLARFLVGAPAAMAGPPPSSLLTAAPLPEGGVHKVRVSNKGNFFSFLRSVQLVAVLFCLMAQFIAIQAPPSTAALPACAVPQGPGHPQNGHPGRAPLTT